jgi:signal transduction histidine kinase
VQIASNGFAAALEELARDTAIRCAIPCSFTSSGPEVQDRVLATHLYRIAQEALTNAVRHSRAQHVRVTLDTTRDRLLLTIADDGCGLPRHEHSTGLGLHSMQHRAGLIGGTLQIREAEGGGTIVHCLVKGWVQDVDDEA